MNNEKHNLPVGLKQDITRAINNVALEAKALEAPVKGLVRPKDNPFIPSADGNTIENHYGKLRSDGSFRHEIVERTSSGSFVRSTSLLLKYTPPSPQDIIARKERERLAESKHQKWGNHWDKCSRTLRARSRINRLFGVNRREVFIRSAALSFLLNIFFPIKYYYGESGRVFFLSDESRIDFGSTLHSVLIGFVAFFILHYFISRFAVRTIILFLRLKRFFGKT
jgi:hypothetical protein